MPFPAGYTMGTLRNIVPTIHLAGLFFFLLCLSVGTVTHLFTFRYTVAQGMTSIPFKFRLLMIFFVVIPVVPGVASIVGFQPEKMTEIASKYTCITTELLLVPGFIIADRQRFGILVALPIVFLNVCFSIAVHWFIVATKKFIYNGPASEKLKRVQRKFLLQVIIQAFLPLSIILVPAFALTITVMGEFFGLGSELAEIVTKQQRQRKSKYCSILFQLSVP